MKCNLVINAFAGGVDYSPGADNEWRRAIYVPSANMDKGSNGMFML